MYKLFVLVFVFLDNDQCQSAFRISVLKSGLVQSFAFFEATGPQLVA